MQVLTASNSRRQLLALALALVLALAAALVTIPSAMGASAQGGSKGNVVPHFEVDPFWPKPLPSNWVLGQVGGIRVDQHDRIWIIQRPGSLTDADLSGNSPAPPVMAFDPQGNLLEAWGPEAGPGPRDFHGCEWPGTEHGIHVDDDDNVWIAGNGGGDHVVLKLTSDGSDCLMQIGQWGVSGGISGSPTHLNRPADMDTDDDARELFVADGYGGRRVAVFDMDTGVFDREILAPPGETWGGPVHCAKITDDDRVHVCDRPNNRVHVFTTAGDFLHEISIAPDTPGIGSAWDVDFSADRAQEFLYDADGENQMIHIVRRSDPAAGEIASFGRGGRYAGMFHWVHNVSTDSRGNLYTAEVSEGKRAQKFVHRGFRPAR